MLTRTLTLAEGEGADLKQGWPQNSIASILSPSVCSGSSCPPLRAYWAPEEPRHGDDWIDRSIAWYEKHFPRRGP